MNGFFHIICHKKEQVVCYKMIPHMCRLVLMSGFYEELSVPTPHSRNAYFFITRLYIICQKPKFRQCYFLVNIKNIKTDILGHILVPVSDGTGGAHRVPPYISPTKRSSNYCQATLRRIVPSWHNLRYKVLTSVKLFLLYSISLYFPGHLLVNNCSTVTQLAIVPYG